MAAREDILADRLNAEPAIFKGCSSSELGVIVGVAALVWLPVSLLLAGLMGAVTMGFGLTGVGVVGTVGGGHRAPLPGPQAQPPRRLLPAALPHLAQRPRPAARPLRAPLGRLGHRQDLPRGANVTRLIASARYPRHHAALPIWPPTHRDAVPLPTLIAAPSKPPSPGIAGVTPQRRQGIDPAPALMRFWRIDTRSCGSTRLLPRTAGFVEPNVWPFVQGFPPVDFANSGALR